MATEIQIELDRRLSSRETSVDAILDEQEMEVYRSRKAEAVKIMVASECSRLKIGYASASSEEIAYLRKMSEVVPCVITTNFDTIIEEGLFENKFNVYSKVSDYYLSNSLGIGEIFKIHGTCNDPSSLVLMEEDYIGFRDKAKIVSAKMLSVLCDYPMLIIGYSMQDPDVREILINLMASLDHEKLIELEKNIIFIQYDSEENRIEPFSFYIESRGYAMSIRAYRTNDFATVFKEVSSMEASLSPALVRRFRKVAKTVQISEKSHGERIRFIGLDDIAESDDGKLVVVVTDRDSAKAFESMPPMAVDDMIRVVLGINTYKGDCSSIVNYFASFGKIIYHVNEYVPIFHFMNGVDADQMPDSAFMREFIEKKDEQFGKKIGTIKLPHDCPVESLDCLESMRKLIDDSRSYAKPLMVTYLLSHDMIGEEQALQWLASIYRDDPKARNDTNMRFAVTYVGYRRYVENVEQ